MLIEVFITLQIILFLFITLHDWIAVPPLNDIQALKVNHSCTGMIVQTVINGLFVLIPLSLTIVYKDHFSVFVLLNIVLFYTGLTIGTILSWWVPYIFGSSQKHKQEFMVFKNTHRFLPARGDNVVPNTFHVILHFQVWTCCVIAWYLLFTHN